MDVSKSTHPCEARLPHLEDGDSDSRLMLCCGVQVIQVLQGI